MRLIDADALLEQYGLKDATKYGNKDEKQREHSYSTMMLYEIADMIEDAPTAYDVEKVVEELEELADENYKAYCIGFNSDDREEYDAYTNAIEIVKQGGVANDACEWTKIDEEGYKNCKCNYDETMPDFFKYCPYCGKR